MTRDFYRSTSICNKLQNPLTRDAWSSSNAKNSLIIKLAEDEILSRSEERAAEPYIIEILGKGTENRLWGFEFS